METVYRIQDSEGRGPWRPGFSHRWVEERPDHETLLPWVVEMPGAMQSHIAGMSIGCGCESLQQLRRWFTSREYATLVRLGYRAVKFRGVILMGRSDTQVLFQRAPRLSIGGTVVDLYPEATHA